jgi:membrane-associated protease RseP (regulator of RpoE activity)
MSSFYKKFRDNIAAGGDAESDSEEITTQGRLMGVLMVVLLAWLAVKSPWTFVFVFGLLVSVFFHELGHFATARLTGMKSTQFFMGFGPRVWSTSRGEVEYGVRALPVGAFVRIIGMNNLDDVAPEDEARSYRAQTFPRKLLVITAGSLMHMVLAVFLFTGVFAISGRNQETGRTIVQLLAPDSSPAGSAGIKVGDQIVSVDGISIHTDQQLVDVVRAIKPGTSVPLVIDSHGHSQTVSVVLGDNLAVPGHGYLGVAAESTGWVRMALPAALGHGVQEIGNTITSSVRGVFTALNPVNSVRHLTNSDSNPATRPTTVVGVSQVSGSVGRSEGLKGVLLLLASVNVFVGVFNMFPLLPFDGGHAAIAIYERVRSRRGRRYVADVAKMVPVATAVVGLLVLLMVTGLYLDITKPLG